MPGQIEESTEELGLVADPVHSDSTVPNPVEPETDEAIVQRVLNGDRASFERILRRYNQRLYRVARSILGRDGDAEDVVQEAYLNAYRHLAEFAGRSSFATWLTRIAVHEASARRRRQRRVRLVEWHEVEALTMDSSPEADAVASTQELGTILRDAIDELPADFRVVFTLRLVEELSTEDTAACLSLSPANVKVRLHRARARLRETIERRLGEDVRRLYQFDGERCDRIVRSVMSRLPQ